MKKIAYDELERDKRGRIRECHFCISKNKNYVCTALEKFYNFEDKENMCGNCPFFKTDEEFMKGWRKGMNKGEKYFPQTPILQ